MVNGFGPSWKWAGLGGKGVKNVLTTIPVNYCLWTCAALGCEITSGELHTSPQLYWWPLGLSCSVELQTLLLFLFTGTSSTSRMPCHLLMHPYQCQPPASLQA